MKFQKLLSLVILLSCLTALTGCAKKIVLHPVDGSDIRMDGDWVCMSQEYVQEVMKARLDK